MKQNGWIILLALVALAFINQKKFDPGGSGVPGGGASGSW